MQYNKLSKYQIISVLWPPS